MFTHINNINDLYINFNNNVPLFFVISYKNKIDNLFYSNLYNLKIENRFLKVFLEIDNNLIKTDLKNIIKAATDLCCDGFLVNITQDVTYKNTKKLYKILNKLPEPYNFGWDIYVKTSTDTTETKLITDDTNCQVNKFNITKNHINYPTSYLFNKNLQPKSKNLSLGLENVNKQCLITIDIDYF